jgi:transcriptional regulator with PAS, ATPase and Fis domain
MRRVLALAARVAPLISTVLITGESGVGKERMARWLHAASPRSGRQFVAINCAALNDALLESELFGHARGAFTGAFDDRPGVFEAAHGGSLLLDEIGDITPSMQVKLLRVVQEREVRRVGETRTRSIDVRLVAATNRDLAAEVERRSFRADLFYRLRVIELRIPPLRERPEDLLDIATAILHQTARRLQRPIRAFTERARNRLLEHDWPGNIRELEHAIERGCALATGFEVDVDDLPDDVRGVTVWPHGSQHPLRERECAYVRAVIGRHNGNRTTAARELGISMSTLKRRLRRGLGGGAP